MAAPESVDTESNNTDKLKLSMVSPYLIKLTLLLVMIKK